MEQLYQQHFYGWDQAKIRSELKITKDNIDDTIYFNWLNFYIKNNQGETKQHKGTGDLSLKVEGKSRPGKIDESGYKLLKEIIQKQPTITLEELAKVFYKKKKIKAGRSILSRACQKLALRHKKLSRYAAE
jgi:hypothetical protein